ncbi:MAG: hypothetical protein IPL70_14350 [Uliginosibacterium sp.]|nr:hypothetical protein [Uliginosibacterium sp.]
MLFLPVVSVCSALPCSFSHPAAAGRIAASSGESVPNQTTSSSSGGSVSTPDTQAPSTPEALGFGADGDECAAQVGRGE